MKLVSFNKRQKTIIKNPILTKNITRPWLRATTEKEKVQPRKVVAREVKLGRVRYDNEIGQIQNNTFKKDKMGTNNMSIMFYIY